MSRGAARDSPGPHTIAYTADRHRGEESPLASQMVGPIDGFIPALKSGIDPKAGFSYPGVLGRKAGRWFRKIRVARSRDKIS